MINEVVLFFLGVRGPGLGKEGGGIVFFARTALIAGQRYVLTCDCNNNKT